MKSKIIILVFAIISIWGCTNRAQKSISLSVLIDKTDALVPKPKLIHIKSFLEGYQYKDGRRSFYLQKITDTNISASFYAELPEADPFGNSLEQKMRVQHFFSQIDTLLQETNTEETHSSSSILKPLVRQLERVQQSNTTDKVVLLYSDLLEASDLFNVYQPQQQRLLITHPKKVIESLQAQLTIPSLDGVHLYLIYYPDNRLNNRLFEKMIEVYKELFKASGLRIHIGIDNNIHL
ncbi:hypothetical protein [Polaribacter vadi]|uniref:hypothetical protein n=1 Tax=Polaribacter vadi TaxID=1774273 RepID=UPI0030EB30DC|tara:strand:- start:16908 stop:17615 length:708 start_codon:yes stop_codon:yes gene_type:complete